MIAQIITDRLPIPEHPATYAMARPWAQALFFLRPDIIQASDGRVKRALNIIASDEAAPIQQAREQNIFKVRSCSVKYKFYSVDLAAKTCTCPDDREARRLKVSDVRICKHRLAVALYFYGPEWIDKLIVQNSARLRELRTQEENDFEQLCRVISTCERITPTHDSADLTDEWHQKRSAAIEAHETSCDELNHALNVYPFF